jgi:hypothetical protein
MVEGLGERLVEQTVKKPSKVGRTGWVQISPRSVLEEAGGVGWRLLFLS